MRVWRAVLLIPALLFLLYPIDASAQGRGKAKTKGGGPAFCRSGAGHPVYGWEWCRERGWDGAYADGSRTRRAVPRSETRQRDPYPDRYRGRRQGDAAFDNGYGDGYEKGLDDGRQGREFDPTRHRWYRSADRQYDASYGSRAAYANVYRDGFRSGFEAGFADGDRYGSGNRSSPFPWPF